MRVSKVALCVVDPGQTFYAVCKEFMIGFRAVDYRGLHRALGPTYDRVQGPRLGA